MRGFVKNPPRNFSKESHTRAQQRGTILCVLAHPVITALFVASRPIPRRRPLRHPQGSVYKLKGPWEAGGGSAFRAPLPPLS